MTQKREKEHESRAGVLSCKELGRLGFPVCTLLVWLAFCWGNRPVLLETRKVEHSSTRWGCWLVNRKFREVSGDGFRDFWLVMQSRMRTWICYVHNPEATWSCRPPCYDMDVYEANILDQGVCVVVITLISALIFSHKNKKAMCITCVPNMHIRGKLGCLKEGFILAVMGSKLNYPNLIESEKLF